MITARDYRIEHSTIQVQRRGSAVRDGEEMGFGSRYLCLACGHRGLWLAHSPAAREDADQHAVSVHGARAREVRS